MRAPIVLGVKCSPWNVDPSIEKYDSCLSTKILTSCTHRIEARTTGLNTRSHCHPASWGVCMWWYPDVGQIAYLQSVASELDLFCHTCLLLPFMPSIFSIDSRVLFLAISLEFWSCNLFLFKSSVFFILTHIVCAMLSCYANLFITSAASCNLASLPPLPPKPRVLRLEIFFSW